MWEWSLLDAHRGTRAAPAERVHRVLLEDLIVRDRDRAYAALLAFLGIPDDPRSRSFFDARADRRPRPHRPLALRPAAARSTPAPTRSTAPPWSGSRARGAARRLPADRTAASPAPAARRARDARLAARPLGRPADRRRRPPFFLDSAADARYDPKAIESRWQQVWEDEETWVVANPGEPGFDDDEAEELRARDAALPLGRAPRRPPQVLLGRRRDRPLPPPPRLQRDPPDGLRRLRPPGREQRDPDRRAPARGDREVDRLLPRAVQAVGHLPRLDPRGRHPRALLLPLDPVDLPEAVRAGPRLPRRGAGPVVPEGRRPCSPTSR